nr:Hint domain-containing protein [Fangia hongkongensis]
MCNIEKASTTTGNLSLKKLTFNKITDTFIFKQKKVYRLSIACSNSSMKIESIFATENHPFYVKNKGFTQLSFLTSEDKLVSLTGHSIAKNMSRHRIEDVYDLTVKDSHTFFVGKQGTWVHNSKDPSTSLMEVLGYSGDPTRESQHLPFATAAEYLGEGSKGLRTLTQVSRGDQIAIDSMQPNHREITNKKIEDAIAARNARIAARKARIAAFMKNAAYNIAYTASKPLKMATFLHVGGMVVIGAGIGLIYASGDSSRRLINKEVEKHGLPYFLLNILLWEKELFGSDQNTGEPNEANV